MKKLLKITITLLFLFTINIKAQELNIQSKYAILYNLTDNEIIYEKNINEKIQIASLTKIMTALVTLENIDDINKQVIITKKVEIYQILIY